MVINHESYERVSKDNNTRIVIAAQIPPEMINPKFAVDKSRVTRAANTCPRCHKDNEELWDYCYACTEEILTTDLSE